MFSSHYVQPSKSQDGDKLQTQGLCWMYKDLMDAWLRIKEIIKAEDKGFKEQQITVFECYNYWSSKFKVKIPV